MAVILPAWLRYAAERKPWKPAQLAYRVWGVDPASVSEREAALFLAEKLEEFFRSLSLPVTLSDLDIGAECFDEMAGRATVNGPVGHYLKLDPKAFTDVLYLAHPGSSENFRP